MNENKHSICKEHNDQFGFHSIMNDGSKCYICNLETKLRALKLIFKDLTLEEVQKISPSINESSFNDFKNLVFGEI